mgnify:CR=1 FL=1
MVFTERQKKVIGSLLIGAGLLMILPGAGDAIFNIPIAHYISDNTGYSFTSSIVITYTLIPIALIWIGAIIHPFHSPQTLLTKTKNRVFGRIQSFLYRLQKDRKFQLAVLVIVLLIWKFLSMRS